MSIRDSMLSTYYARPKEEILMYYKTIFTTITTLRSWQTSPAPGALDKVIKNVILVHTVEVDNPRDASPFVHNN